jgi:hypothetical protein
VSDETTRPTTYGEKLVRGQLPTTSQFEDPYWWRELGANIDGYLAEIERLRAKVAEFEQQSQPVNERLLTAAQEMSRAAEKLMHWHDWGSNNEGMVVSADSARGIWDCKRELTNAIAAAESEIAEREKPVTRVWLEEQCTTVRPNDPVEMGYVAINPELVVGAFHDGRIQVNGGAITGGWPGMTHGDMLDLMRVLGGAT